VIFALPAALAIGAANIVAAQAMRSRNAAEQETAQLSDAMFSPLHWRGDHA
jgi:hypothetical protein